MQSFSIRTYSSQSHQLNRFYVLNKGNNCGKPSWTPWRNSFIVEADEENLHKLYWLCYSLHLSNGFYPIRHGSVFDTMRIGDVRKLLNSYQLDSFNDDYIRKLQLIERIEADTIAKLRAITVLKTEFAKSFTRLSAPIPETP